MRFLGVWQENCFLGARNSKSGAPDWSLLRRLTVGQSKGKAVNGVLPIWGVLRVQDT